MNIPSKKVKDITGQKFGRATVVEFAGIKNEDASWKIKCDCGNEKIILGFRLRNGTSVSCGCLQKEMRHDNGNRMCTFRKPIWINTYSDGLLTLTNRKTGQEYHVFVDNEDIHYLNYFQWSPSVISKKIRIQSAVPDTSKNNGKQKLVRIYQVIMKVQKSDHKLSVVDHLFGNTLDNRKEKLAVVTQSQNAQNNYKKRAKIRAVDKHVPYKPKPFCKRGHEIAVVGRSPWNRKCKGCIKEDARKRYKKELIK
jgi:hypothetical protein